MAIPARFAWSMELGARLMRAYFDNDFDEIERLHRSDPKGALNAVLDVASLLLEERCGDIDSAREFTIAYALIASTRLEWEE